MTESILQPGATLGHYRIVSLLGAGGMGQVYLAADDRLKRNVALKILPDTIVHDESRLRRFTLEAQTASALNHPSIVTIYEIGSAPYSSGERHYIAMEVIEGKTLRESPVNRSNLKKLLPPFIEIADGLAKAHGAGIVHRDLKPENIMITADGRAKIVDFGLAKLVPFEDGIEPNAPTAVLETRAGTVLGTIGYMAPEQVEAGAVDHRTDIFSLGCVLYESITGARAFAGKSAVDTLHQIVHNEPAPVAALSPDVPADLIRVVNRCLAKDPDERFQSAKEVSIELRALLRQAAEPNAPVAAARRSQGRRWILAVAAVLLIAAAVAAAMLVSIRRPGLSSYRFTPLETTPNYEGFPAWSPDGKTIAYVAEADGVLQVFTRSLGSSRRAQITRQPRDCKEPFWSPDSTRIYFISIAGDRDSLWAIGAAGGSPQLVLADVANAAISPDGKMLALLREERKHRGFSMRLEFADGDGRNVRPFEHSLFGGRRMIAGSLRFSPDGSKLGAWLLVRGTQAVAEFWEISLPGLVPRRLDSFSNIQRAYPFAWFPDNRHLVFGGELDGALSGFHLWIADTASSRVRALTATPSHEAYPSLSPDGKTIVFTTEEADFDLLSVSLADGSTQPLLASSRVERMPAWAPDGAAYAFVTNRSGTDEVWLRSSSGAFERPIVSRNDFNDGQSSLIASVAFSRDGQRIAYQRSIGNYRIWISSVEGGAPVPLNRKALTFEDHPTWSPDGEWIAFTANKTGSGDGSVLSLMKVRVGLDTEPVVLSDALMGNDVKWSPDGTWIAFETIDGITLISPDGANKRVLLEDSWLTFDWSRDGKSIIALRNDVDMHIELAKVDVATGAATTIADLGVSPPAMYPFQGLSLAPDGKSVATSLIRLRGDLWLLEGWEKPQSRFPSLSRN